MEGWIDGGHLNLETVDLLCQDIRKALARTFGSGVRGHCRVGGDHPRNTDHVQNSATKQKVVGWTGIVLVTTWYRVYSPGVTQTAMESFHQAILFALKKSQWRNL